MACGTYRLELPIEEEVGFFVLRSTKKTRRLQLAERTRPAPNHHILWGVGKACDGSHTTERPSGACRQGTDPPAFVSPQTNGVSATTPSY